MAKNKNIKLWKYKIFRKTICNILNWYWWKNGYKKIRLPFLVFFFFFRLHVFSPGDTSGLDSLLRLRFLLVRDVMSDTFTLLLSSFSFSKSRESLSPMSNSSWISSSSMSWSCLPFLPPKEELWPQHNNRFVWQERIVHYNS